ncbi:MAG: hypothetical protein KF887_07620 [Paracoccaceae bacterium]|nr:MAG: hypothetical protein KF887_07620 [Paracoccaceae bacterium]
MAAFNGTKYNEVIYMNFLSSTVTASPGDASPSAADDTIFGAGGNDIITVNGGNDMIYGGNGDDSISFFGDSASVFGGRDDDYIYMLGDGQYYVDGGVGNDTILGAAATDTLFGGDGDDVIYVAGGTGRGANGQDALFGGATNDRLFGGADDDHLTGNAGNDTMSGGTGQDTFVFHAAAHEGRNLITDFEVGVDKISISGVSFADLTLRSIQGGTGTSIILDSGTRIVLRGVDIDTLQESDFYLF